MLRDIGEAGALEAMRKYVVGRGKKIAAGFGDDAAAIDLPESGERLLLTADMLIENVHFSPRYTDWRSIGRKAIAVNVSDIAAMGGRPAETLISLGAPSGLLKNDLTSLYKGLAFEASKWGAFLIGGDTVRSPRVAINVTLLGRIGLETKLPLRSACRPGQKIYLTGTPGESAAGLALLKSRTLAPKLDEPWAKQLAKRHLLPTPRLKAGQALAAGLGDLAMIDVSDGVANECRLLAQASGARMELNAEALYLSPSLIRACKALRKGAIGFALYGGEDYELLFATHSGIDQVRMLLKSTDPKLRVTEIGHVRRGHPGIRISADHASRTGIRPFRHFT